MKTVACDISDGSLTLQWDKNSADVKVRTSDFFSSSGAPNAIESFRRGLTGLVSRGCIRAEEEYALKRRIVENVPLPPSLAGELLVGNLGINGFIDLTSDFRLRLTTPVYREGSPAIPENAVADDATEYIFTHSTAEDRVRISAARDVQSNSMELNKSNSNPSSDARFYPSFGYFRLVLRQEEGESPLTQSILLSSGDATLVGEATALIFSKPRSLCEAIGFLAVNCVVFPPDVGVSPELRIIANGKPVFVSVPKLYSLFQGSPIPETLRVQRLFHGRLIPVRLDSPDAIRTFDLMPGDRVNW